MDREKREPERTRNKNTPHFLARFIPCALESYNCQKWILLVSVSLIIAILVSPSFIIEYPLFHLGDIADRNVKAKRDFLVQDEEATAKKREEAVRQSAIVYDLDDRLTENTTERLAIAFKSMHDYLAGLDSDSFQPKPPQPMMSSLPAKNLSSLALSDHGQQILHKKKDFEDILGCPVTGEIFASLMERQFSREIQEKIEQLIKNSLELGIVSAKA
jgi:membrane-associated HD superfamily phosphohydrolase